VIDVFVEELNLAELGFDGVDPPADRIEEGRTLRQRSGATPTSWARVKGTLMTLLGHVFRRAS